MSFSANLKALLGERKMQIKDLSAKTGISKNTIDNYLSGQKSLPNAENAIKIAAAMNTTVEYLVTGSKTLDAGGKYKKLFAAIERLDDKDFSALAFLVTTMLHHYKD